MIAPELSYYTPEERRFAERHLPDEAAYEIGHSAILFAFGGVIDTPQYSRSVNSFESKELVLISSETRSAFGRTALSDMMRQDHTLPVTDKAVLGYGHNDYDLAA